jgi:hypothetical protein
LAATPNYGPPRVAYCVPGAVHFLDVAWEAWKWLHGLSESEAGKLVEEIPKRIDKGSFQPTFESLRSYTCPAWFRDAKFGISARQAAWFTVVLDS